MAKETKTTEESTEVASTNQNALAVAGVMDDSMFGAGFEGMDAESFAIPFIQVLQKMSPLVDEDDPKYIPGAKAGMFFNTVTQKLYDGKAGITVIPCAYKRSFIQWGGREGDNGGFKGEHDLETFRRMAEDENQVKLIDGKYYAPNEDGTVNEKKNDYFADTRSHYVLVIDNETGEVGRAIMSLSSSQIKASKMLCTSLQQRKMRDSQGNLRVAPMFANVVRATTVPMSNDKGTWSGLRFDIEGSVTDKDVFREACEFYKDINAGAVQVDHSKNESATRDTEAASGTPQDAEQF